ncbi:MAG: 2-hydroxyacid dehydrogenase [Gemmatimonadales bacterium]|nr:MAG: 2-hydroxyacid dehydrogenase [Gemmatimonadales bacterium]
MRIALFSTKPYDRTSFEEANEEHGHELHFFEPRLTPDTVQLARGFEGVCVFVNDQVDGEVVHALADGGTRILLLRSAGFNHVELEAADGRGITVARVPAYSPHAVAEHAMGLVLTLNRKLHRAYARVREGNFALDGLLGFDLNGKTVGVIGTGRIGTIFARIAAGFGCRVLAHDPYPSDEILEFGARYVELDDLFGQADIIALHLPLTPNTHHLIDGDAVSGMKEGVMLINTSRGGLVDTRAVIEGLKSGRIGSLGLDVYEEEEKLFFEDLSGTVIQDDVFARLLTFPNVLVTGHQGFFTREALAAIAGTTLGNATAFEGGGGELHGVTLEAVKA